MRFNLSPFWGTERNMGGFSRRNDPSPSESKEAGEMGSWPGGSRYDPEARAKNFWKDPGKIFPGIFKKKQH